MIYCRNLCIYRRHYACFFCIYLLIRMGQISDSVAVEKQTCRLQNRLMAREGDDEAFSTVAMGSI